MPFYTDNSIETMMMVLNSFGPRFNPQSIPAYDDWVANNSFDPFGPEPFAPTSYTNPGIPSHLHYRGDPRIEAGVDLGNRVYRGHGSSVDMTRDIPQERSRFAFAQKRIERTTNASVSQIPAAHAHQPPSGRSRIPAATKATPATVPRVVGPRPLRSQRASHSGREPTLVAPRAVYPLPKWLAHFEDYEEELLAEFCPPLEGSSPSTSTFPAITGVEFHPDCVPECPPLSMDPPFGFADSGSDYTSTDIEVGDWCLEEDEGFDEWDEDYDPFEFELDSDFGSDYASFRSESSTPTSYYMVDALD